MSYLVLLFWVCLTPRGAHYEWHVEVRRVPAVITYTSENNCSLLDTFYFKSRDELKGFE